MHEIHVPEIPPSMRGCAAEPALPSPEASSWERARWINAAIAAGADCRATLAALVDLLEDSRRRMTP